MDDPLLEATAHYTEIDSSLRRLARGLVPDAHVADDAVQEAWVTSLERQHVPSLSKREWMRGVVRFKVLALLRRDRRRVRRELSVAREEGSSAGEDTILQRSVIEFLRCEVARLSDPYRTVIERHFFEDLTLREIAESSGRPLGTVKTHLHRGLESLRDKLDRRHSGDRKAWSLPLLAWLARGASWGATRSTGISPALAVFAAATVAVFVTALALQVPALVDRDAGSGPLAALVPIERADAASGWSDERTPWDRLRAEDRRTPTSDAPTSPDTSRGAGHHGLLVRARDRANNAIGEARVAIGVSGENELRDVGEMDAQGIMELDVSALEIAFAVGLVNDAAPRAAVRCSAPGYITSEVLLPELSANEEREIVVVLETPDRTVQARIVDEGGNAIEAAHLEIARPARTHAPRSDRALVRDLPLTFDTGALGACAVHGLPRTAVELTISASGFESARHVLGLDASDGQVHTFRLRRAGGPVARAWASSTSADLEVADARGEARNPTPAEVRSTMTGSTVGGSRGLDESFVRNRSAASTSSDSRAGADMLDSGTGGGEFVSFQNNAGTSGHRPSAPMDGLQGLQLRDTTGADDAASDDAGGGSSHGLTGGGEGGDQDGDQGSGGGSSGARDEMGDDALGTLAPRFSFSTDPVLERLTRAWLLQHEVEGALVTIDQGLGFPRGACSIPAGRYRLTLWLAGRMTIVEEFELPSN